MSTGNLEALKLLLSESRSLFHLMKLLAEDSYQEDSMSGGNRGILQDLACLGPQSESQLAKLRPLSRLHIEEMISPLKSSGYIRHTADTDDQEFPLMELTEKGLSFIRSSSKRELDILTNISDSIPKEDMLVALDVLRSIRKTFDGDASQNVVSIERRKGERRAAG